MKRQRGHINESNLDTLAVTCTVQSRGDCGRVVGKQEVTWFLLVYASSVRNRLPR
jgi:hypothetical protein